MRSTGLGRHELNRILALNIGLSMLVALVALLISPEWALRYAAVALLAAGCWYALTAIIRGYTERNPLELMAGFALKPLLLVVLLILGKHGMIEISSLIAGMNTFFVIVLGYLAAQALLVRRSVPPQGIPSGSAEVNG